MSDMILLLSFWCGHSSILIETKTANILIECAKQNIVLFHKFSQVEENISGPGTESEVQLWGYEESSLIVIARFLKDY